MRSKIGLVVVVGRKLNCTGQVTGDRSPFESRPRSSALFFPLVKPPATVSTVT